VAKLKNLIRGDAFTLTIPVKNADGTPFDFTGYKAFLTVKSDVDDAGEMTLTTPCSRSRSRVSTILLTES
jgi:hypothetical protein